MLLVQVHAVGICEEVGAGFSGPAPANNLIDATWIAPVVQQTEDDLNGTLERELQVFGVIIAVCYTREF